MVVVVVVKKSQVHRGMEGGRAERKPEPAKSMVCTYDKHAHTADRSGQLELNS